MSEKEMSNMKSDNKQKTPIIVASYSDDSIGKRLHPDYPFSYNSILGELYSLGNGMRYINSIKFDIAKLNKKINTAEYIKINQGGKKFIKNYWEIVTLLTIDRILADKKLVYDMVETYSDDVSNIEFILKYKLKKGIIHEEIVNNKLYIYGKILTSLVNKVVSAYNNYIKSDNVEIDNIRDMSNKTYKYLKNKIKEDVFDIAVTKADGNICEGLVDINNDELKKAFLGKK